MSLIEHFAYRALMPRLYHWQNFPPALDGRIDALKFPIMRIMGPYWSFGIEVASIEPQEPAGLPDKALYALRLMQEHRGVVTDVDPHDPPGHEFPHMHRPQLFRAGVNAFYSYDSGKPDDFLYFADRGNQYESASRLSIIGVHTLKGEQEGLSKERFLDHTPVHTGQAPAGRTTDLLLATIGGDPGYREGDTTHLPACQMIGGQIGFRPTAHYLKMLRMRLAIDKGDPEYQEDDADLVYLLPDGFALFGALNVPWIGDSPVSGWFKVKPRFGEKEGKVIATGAEMVVWSGTPHPGTVMPGTSSWTDAIENLKELLFESAGGPNWLTLAANGVLDESDLFWPLQMETQPFDFLLERETPEDDRVFVRETALAARLADRSGSEAPLSMLTLKPERFELYRSDTQFVLATSRPANADGTSDRPAGRMKSKYAYADAAESFDINEGKPLDLAVPLMDTAAMLREAQDMPPPASDRPGLLWTFVPVTAGWLHLPLPDATLDTLDRIRPRPEVTAKAKASDTMSVPPPKRTSGALGFQNRPDAPGFNKDERLWSFTLTDVDDGEMDAVFDSAQKRLVSAEIVLSGGAVLFDGALPLTPFRQTGERLLPDHAERALATRGFLAVSPSLLRDVEADIWALERDGSPAMRVTLSVKNLSFLSKDKASRLTGEISLVTEMHPESLSDRKAARAPWLWARQSRIPTVQTMPLALAGDARRLPSGSRELAPLRKTGDPGIRSEFKFTGALVMSRSAPDFNAEGTWLRPTADLAWTDEVGMTLLTLPSLTAFPGLAGGSKDGNSDRLDAPDLYWSDRLSTTIALEVRHDLAIRDEAYATAGLPRRPARTEGEEAGKTDSEADGDNAGEKAKASTPVEPEETLVPQPSIFTPRADNGPDAPPDAPLEGSVWHGVWTGLQRDLALSATEQRTMVVLKGKAIVLQGVFGDVTTPITADFSEFARFETHRDGGDSSFYAGGPAPWQLISVGRWSMDLGDDKRIVSPGLPSEDNLTGLSGQLPLARTANLDFGTARLTADDTGFHDQRGLQSGPAVYNGGLIARKITIHEPGGVKTEATLVTAKAPLRGDGLHFWFSDLPLDASGTRLHPEARLGDTGETWKRNKINASSYRNAPLQGYRWWLRDEDTGDINAPPVAAGLQFTPLALEEITVEGGAVTQVKILGRPALRLDDDPTEPRISNGVVMLVLTVTGNSFTASYEAAHGADGSEIAQPIHWPLARRSGFDGPVPLLELDSWPGTKKKDRGRGKLRAAIEGLPFEVSVRAHFDDNGLLQVELDGAEPKQGDIGLQASKLRLTTERIGGNGALKLTGAELVLSGRVAPPGDDGWYVDPEIVLDLTKPGLPVGFARGKLHTPVFGDVDIQAKKTPGGEQLIGLGGNGLHLEWTCQDDLPELGSAFAVSGLAGLISTGLSVDPEAKQFRLQVESAVLEASATLSVHASGEAEPQKLALRQQRDDAGFRIYGTLRLPNLFAWPDIDMPEDPAGGWTQISLQPGSSVSIVHKASAVLEGQPFHGFANDGLTLVARVEHTLTWGEGKEPQMKWAMFQPMRLLDVADLREKLLADEQATDVSEADLSVLAVTDPQALGLTDLAAAKLIFRNGAAHHAALRGALRDIWLGETEGLAGLAVDLSAHHQMDRKLGDNPDWLVLPLPHLSVLTGDGPWKPSKELRQALSSHIETAEPLFVHGDDLPRKGALARPGRTVFSDARSRLINAMADSRPGDVPAKALGLETLLVPGGAFPSETRSVFQAFTLVTKDGEPRLAAVDYPALHIALVFGVLKAQGLNSAPQSFGFAHGGVAAEPVTHEGKTDTATLLNSLQAYAERLAGHLVSVPTPEEETHKPESARVGHDLILHAVSRDGRTIRKITQRFSASGTNAEKDAENDQNWATQTLLRLAPWTRYGTLTRISTFDGERAVFLLPRPNTKITAPERDVRPERSTVLPRRAVPQSQRITPPADLQQALPARLSAGYSAAASQAALWASENAITPGTGTGGPRLTAAANETVWQLDGGPASYLAPGGHDLTALRMHDRSRVSFREAAAWREKETVSQRITAALPEDYHGRLPGALHPVAPAPSAPKRRWDNGVQAVLPGRSFTARLADRAGAWTEVRQGLDHAGLCASERPLNLRIPRPPLLSVNDRTRGSSHEAGHLVAAEEPTLILHGPREAPPGTGPAADGLSRAPRSAWATLLRIVSPAAGLIDASWDGTIRFEAEPSTGIERWRVRKAEAQIGPSSFTATLPGTVDAPYPALDTPIENFSDPLTGKSLRSAALSARPATPVHVLLEVETSVDGGTPLFRQVRFELLAAGTGIGLTEAPVYLRFDDPEYNDRLGGLAKMDFAPVHEDGASEMVFAADRSDVRPDDRLELALGLRFDGIEAANRKTFEKGQNGLEFGGEEIVLKAVRRRVTDDVPVSLTIETWENAAAPVLAKGLSLQGDLKLPPNASKPLLKPDDQLELTVRKGARTILKLVFDVVDTPLLPSNPSGIAQLRLFAPDSNPEDKDPEDKDLMLSAPLYANSPPPTIVEIVDPRDLLDGVVRRRAIYQWRSFAPRQGQFRNALQKVSGSGASWIEPDLAQGWVAAPQIKGESK